VMRHGKIVEMGPSDEVLFAPKSDYTKLLIDSIPGQALFSARRRRGRV
jgi:peptide/nickel transport system ATP-binding protein